jgi:hypothetical protein
MVNLPKDDSYFGVTSSNKIDYNTLFGGSVFKVQDSNSAAFDWTNAGRARKASYKNTRGEIISTKFVNARFDNLKFKENIARYSPAPCIDLSISSTQIVNDYGSTK